MPSYLTNPVPSAAPSASFAEEFSKRLAISTVLVALVCVSFAAPPVGLALIFLVTAGLLTELGRLARRVDAWPGAVMALIQGTAIITGMAVMAAMLESRPLLLILLLVATCATDIGAYLVGRTARQILERRGLKPHSFFPAISPHKTLEGVVGGVVASWLAIVGIATQTGLTFGPFYGYILAMVPIVAIAGDLLESALKRETHVKDAGTLLGPHGGLLDRLDSIVAVMAVLGTATLVAEFLT